MADYSDYISEFEVDGSLRDIYIFNGSHNLWKLFIGMVLKADFKYSFNHGERDLFLPLTFNEMSLLQKSDPTTLKMLLDRDIQVNCHFFSYHQIELDIHPREINDQTAFDTLLRFMKLVSITLKRDVLLCHENSPDHGILKVIKNSIVPI